METGFAQLDKHCVFHCESFYFAVPAFSVREVIPAPKLVGLPCGHPALAGLCHHRNEFLPVISLAHVISAQPVNVAAQQALVLCVPHCSWVILVDEVAALQQLDISLDAAPGDDFWSAAVMGSATCRDHIVKVLDPHALFRYIETTFRRFWQVPNADRTTGPLELADARG